MAQWLEKQEGGVTMRPEGWLRVRLGRRRESPVAWAPCRDPAMVLLSSRRVSIGRSNSQCLQGLEGVLENVCGSLAQKSFKLWVRMRSPGRDTDAGGCAGVRRASSWRAARDKGNMGLWVHLGVLGEGCPLSPQRLLLGRENLALLLPFLLF